jgi:hypothetical protein
MAARTSCWVHTERRKDDQVELPKILPFSFLIDKSCGGFSFSVATYAGTEIVDGDFMVASLMFLWAVSDGSQSQS